MPPGTALTRPLDPSSRSDIEDHTWRWTIAALVTAAPLVIALCWTMWTAPYPISETVGLMELAGVTREPVPASRVFADPVVHDIFSPTARSWYRPFFHMTWYVFWNATGSLPATLVLFKVLEIASIVALVLLFLWQLQPRTAIDYGASTCAVAVLLGAPGLRENLELPMLMTLIAMPMALVVWRLLERPYHAWHTAIIAVLLVVATGYKEQGLVLLPLVVAAWWARAPGITRATAAVTTGLVLAYLAFRFSTRAAWMPFEQEVGLGFGALSPGEASDRFGAFPYGMYAYNALSTGLNILFSEPTSGTFRIVRDVVRGTWAPWALGDLLSSAAMTGLIGWYAARTWRRERGQPWSARTRLLVAVAVTLAASAALGFNYTRDRHGGMALVFYALAAYAAMREAALVAAQQPRQWRAVATGILLIALCGAWQMRVIGSLDSVRLRAAKVHREWLTDTQQRRIDFASRDRFMRILETMAPQGFEPAPTALYPRWAEALFGER